MENTDVNLIDKKIINYNCYMIIIIDKIEKRFIYSINHWILAEIQSSPMKEYTHTHVHTLFEEKAIYNKCVQL